MNNSNLTTLEKLQPNKSVVFYSPIEGNDILVRTGTIQDSYCLYHAILHAYSKQYVSMNDTGRVRFIKKLKSSIGRSIDKDKWENLSNGVIAKVLFKENVNTLLSEFYKFIETDVAKTKNIREIIRKVITDKVKDRETYTLIIEMIPIDIFNKIILSDTSDKVSMCKKSIVDLIVKHYTKEFNNLNKNAGKNKLEQEKVDFYIKKLNILIQTIVDEAYNISYEEYVSSLLDNNIDIDSVTIKEISDKVNRDIYFIDSITRLPYKIGGNENIKNRTSIIVMCTCHNHYEVVGKLLSGNRIQREFDYKDSLIKRIYTFLYKPEKIPDKYPNLVSFLDKNIRKDIGLDLSDSEAEKHRSRSRSRSRSLSRDNKPVNKDKNSDSEESNESSTNENSD